jgi:hypothetical protein
MLSDRDRSQIANMTEFISQLRQALATSYGINTELASDIVVAMARSGAFNDRVGL